MEIREILKSFLTAAALKCKYKRLVKSHFNPRFKNFLTIVKSQTAIKYQWVTLVHFLVREIFLLETLGLCCEWKESACGTEFQRKLEA